MLINRARPKIVIISCEIKENTDKQNAKREMMDTATPDPVDAEPDDDFGFSEESTMFFDSKQYSPTRREDV